MCSCRVLAFVIPALKEVRCVSFIDCGSCLLELCAYSLFTELCVCVFVCATAAYITSGTLWHLNC